MADRPDGPQRASGVRALTARARGKRLEIVVDSQERYPHSSRLITLPHVHPGLVAELLARVQVRRPSMPVCLAETRPSAEEWSYRFLDAPPSESVADERVAERGDDLAEAGALVPRPPVSAEVRAQAQDQGSTVSAKGRLPMTVVDAYLAARA